MRGILNISLPVEMMKWVKLEAKNRQFTSISEFFRSIIRHYQEEKLLEELRESEKEIAEGKGKVLRSLKDLR